MTQNQLKILQNCMKELENITQEDQGIYYSDLLSVLVTNAEKISYIKFTKKVEQAIRVYIISIIANSDIDYRIKNELLVAFLKF
jgi:hypothetical protein